MRHVLVVDAHADPFNLGSGGAIFLGDLVTGEVTPLYQDPQWKHASDVEFDGVNWTVTDALHHEAWSFRASRLGQVNSDPIMTTQPLTLPIRRFERADGTRLVVDGWGDPNNVGQPTGAIYEEGNFGQLQLLHAGIKLRRPADLLEDEEGNLYVLDADTRATAWPPVNGWQPEGALLDEQLDVVAESPDWISPLAACFIPWSVSSPHAGKAIVIDTNAGVLTGPNKTGKAFAVDISGPRPVPPSHIELITDDARFCDPVDVIHEKDANVLVVDLNSDPGGFGWDGTQFGYGKVLPPNVENAPYFGPGCVWRLNVDTGDIEAALVTHEFVSPTRIRPHS